MAVDVGAVRAAEIDEHPARRRRVRSSAWRELASMSRCGSNETSQSGCRPNRTRAVRVGTPGADRAGSRRRGRSRPARRTQRMSTCRRAPTRSRTRPRPRSRPATTACVPARASCARAGPSMSSIGSAVAGTRMPIARAQDRVLAGHRDRRRDRRACGRPIRAASRRATYDVDGQRRIALLLRIELAERRQIVVVLRAARAGRRRRRRRSR